VFPIVTAWGIDLDRLLEADDEARLRRYPGPSDRPQPVHAVLVPADQVTADLVTAWGAQALATMATHGPLLRADADLVDRVRHKLTINPLEDLHVDTEDGYGSRPDDEEDRDVRAAARAMVQVLAQDSAPSCWGLRIRSLEGPTRARGVRTLQLFLETVLALGPLPAGFRVMLPKVTSVAQVLAMDELLAAGEEQLGVPLPLELQVETPQAVLGAEGRSLVAPMLHAAAGRCVALHYGTYDYSAALGITAGHQSLEHPVADHAKAVMQVAAAETGVQLCDGSTNVLPVGDTTRVRAAWELHARLVRRSLARGWYQGWDLHPGQLPSRYAATYAFYREGLVGAREPSGTLEEPATARALRELLMRGVACGALDEGEL
jgi:citrate lyase beta subunit